MDALKEFSVPLRGLKPGAHVYSFELANAFFSHFEKSPIQEGQFKVNITLDRKESLGVMEFDIQGTYKCVCDRCLTMIDLPINSHKEIVMKFEEAVNKEEEDEIVYISTQASEWNAAQLIYEFICLAMPLINVYDCDGLTCNQEVLKKLSSDLNTQSEDTSIWESLKNIKLN